MAMNDHENRLMDYVYDELEPSEREAFERQLAADADLRLELERIQSTRSLMSQVVDEEPPQALYYDLIREARKAVAEEHQPSFFQRFSAALLRPQAATALLVLVVAVTGVYLVDNNISRMPDDPRDVVSSSELPSRSEVAVANEGVGAPKADLAKVPVETEPVLVSESAPAPAPTPPSDDLESFGGVVAEAAPEPPSKAKPSPTVAVTEKARGSKRTAKRKAKKAARRSKSKHRAAEANTRVLALDNEGLGQVRPEPSRSLGMARSGKRSAMTQKTVVQKKTAPVPAPKASQRLARLDSMDDTAAAEAPAAEDALEEQAEPKPAPEPYHTAMSDYRAQRYGQAIRGFNRVLVDKKWGNRVYSARLHLARAYRKQRKTARALAQYRLVLQSKQSLAQRQTVLLETARLEMSLGMLGAARSHIREAIGAQKNPPPAAAALLKKVEERIRKNRERKADTKKKAGTPSKAQKSK